MEERRRWTEEDKQKLIDLIDEGKDIYQVAWLMGRTVSSVNGKYYAYRHEGCLRNVNSPQKRWEYEDTKTLKEMYWKGETLMKISKTLNRKYSSVQNKVRTLIKVGKLSKREKY